MKRSLLRRVGATLLGGVILWLIHSHRVASYSEQSDAPTQEQANE